jgi:4-alpha-glucanotransferase
MGFSETMPAAEPFLDSPTAAAWKRIGTRRRAGVSTPLFSLRSKNSAGIGEIPDLELLADWCRVSGQSLIQLLPMNDVGFNFRPYDAESCFALEPMHLCLDKVSFVDLKPFLPDIGALRRRYPLDSCWFDTRVKKDKLALLRKMFLRQDKKGERVFAAFRREQHFWLDDYALYKVIKEKRDFAAWEAWPEPLRTRQDAALKKVREEEKETLEFHAWMQWQLYLQFRATAQAVKKKGVFLMGDLPFLVSRDSADVWSRPYYFKLRYSAGAPPDLYFAEGQRWGMPPYDWPALEAAGHDFLREKLKYAENFYHLYRIDHFVGLFRLWTFPREGAEEERRHGSFDPPDEKGWEAHGERILSVMLSSTRMLPCAEDLGTVPECSFRLLERYAIPGLDIQRWMRDWEDGLDFKEGDRYRPNAIVTLSTHDMSPFPEWWEEEAGTVERVIFERKCGERGIPFEPVLGLFDLKKSPSGRLRWKKAAELSGLLAALRRPEQEIRDLVDLFRSTVDEREKFWKAVGLSGEPEEACSAKLLRAALRTASAARSVFCVQLLQDWLALDDWTGKEGRGKRINRPGLVDEKNWRFRVPVFLEDMKTSAVNRILLDINKETGRAE